jgi:hypothetical protein
MNLTKGGILGGLHLAIQFGGELVESISSST